MAIEAASGERLRDEVCELTCELIRIDTSNPPGRESIAAEFLAGYLAEAGVESELTGPDPERLNLIARIAGAGEGPSLMLMAHTDVVPAPDADWSLPPFAGELRDGRVYGRGAADMKGELAARVVAFAEVARHGETPSATSSSSPRPTKSATPPTSGCPGWSANAATCAATTRSTRAAAWSSSSPTVAAS